MIAQRTYGKQGNDLAKLAKIFSRVLSAHEPAKVIEAIGQWILHGGSDFPTPHDIENILKPKPKADYTLYSRLLEKRKESSWSLSAKEEKYITWYEGECLKGL